MTGKLTDKKKAIELLSGALGDAWAAEIWEKLVAAGLAEEQREPGWYWVKWHASGRWEPMEWGHPDSGGHWRLGDSTLAYGHPDDPAPQPYKVGRQMHPPEDE